MNCKRFEQELDRLLEETLDQAARVDAEAHSQHCPRCRRLEQVARGALDLDPPDITTAILERTSGPSCRRALDLACALVDGDLEEKERSLVSGHLEHCASCAAVVSTLEELRQSLPAMAALEPPPAFNAAVLRATTAGYGVRHGFWDGFMERLRTWARQPRFTLEAAYIGTLLMVAVLGNPDTFLDKTSPYVHSMLQVDVRSAWEYVVQSAPSEWMESGKSKSAQAGIFLIQLGQAGTSAGDSLMGLLRGEEELWKPLVSPAVSAARSSLDAAVKVIEESERVLFGQAPVLPDRGK